MTIAGQRRRRKWIQLWLFGGALLIAIMIVLGGITRLTQSGLSIVEWRPLTGWLPPTTEDEWNLAFLAYQNYPEYKTINQHLTSTDFRTIYWWEYIHRLWGRLMGIAFLGPFIVFLLIGALSRGQMFRLSFVLMLASLQAFIGWFMVQSGLQDLPHVSHLRLLIHFLLALGLLGLVLMEGMRASDDDRTEHRRRPPPMSLLLGVILVIQLSYGALVAGLRAGFFYNTFPLMGDHWLPANLMINSDTAGWIYHDPGWVQFIHRWLGILFLIQTGVYLYRWKDRLPSDLIVFGTLVACQVVLGVCVLVFSVPVFLGVLHQTIAIGIFASFIVHYYRHFAGKEIVP